LFRSALCTIMQRTMSESGHETFTEPQAGRSPAPAQDAAHREAVSLSRAFGGPSLLREILETALLTLVVFLVLNTLTGRFQVRGQSMEPTLHNGQYLVVSKLAYWLRPPGRGDIVVFRPPNGASDDYIKRIVGLPGERVTVRDGEIRVDGAPLEEPYIPKQGSYSGSWELGPDQYFVLGDNRSNSSDSHTWGTLPGENIIGKAWLCYWPPEAWGLVQHQEFPKPARRG
jgi:signal peptidase I